LRKVSVRFLEWFDSPRLVPKSKTYYQDGWRLLTTTILGTWLDAINNVVAERLSFTGSAANTNCALRTLRRLLHKAEEWKLIRRAPKIKLLPEKERSLVETGNLEKTGRAASRRGLRNSLGQLLAPAR